MANSTLLQLSITFLLTRDTEFSNLHLLVLKKSHILFLLMIGFLVSQGIHSTTGWSERPKGQTFYNRSYIRENIISFPIDLSFRKNDSLKTEKLFKSINMCNKIIKIAAHDNFCRLRIKVRQCIKLFNNVIDTRNGTLVAYCIFP